MKPYAWQPRPVAAGFATPEELGDTATPRRWPAWTRRGGDIADGGLPAVRHSERHLLRPQLWQATVARHAPYRPPAP